MNTKRMRFILFSILGLIPVMIVISISVYAYTDSLFILPSEKYDAIGWWPIANGESMIDSFEFSRRKIVLEYTLRGSPAYAGFSIFLDRDYPFLDLSEYSELTVRLTAAHAKHFGVIIQTFEKDITQQKDGNYFPMRYCQIRNEIKSGTGTYTIRLADLNAPEWWISLYATPGKALDASPLKESCILQLFFDDIELAGKRDRIEVEEISFHSPAGLLLTALVIGSICYYIVLAGIFILPRLKKSIEGNRAELLSSYRRIDDTSAKQRDAEVVRSYISTKYSDPDISLETISRDTGISQKRIRDTVLGEYSMTFKECINRLRIKEAKRLLAETDTSIIDIAFSLGFNSNAYFASNFRSREGLSPSEYRDKFGKVK